MTTEDILNYCLSKAGAYLDFPFGEIPVCVKVEKKLFAQIFPKQEDYKLTLNCDRMAGEVYRNLYPGTVVRGYHCPSMLQPFFNTIYLNGVVPDTEIKMMIDHSYLRVVGKLSKKKQQELLSTSK